MKPKRLRARHLPADFLRDDYPRRFRNAVLTIMLMHPRPIQWIERAFPSLSDGGRVGGTPPYRDPDGDGAPYPGREGLQLVEAVARYLILKNYSFFHRSDIGWLIFRDWPINDRGTLTPG